VGKGEKMKKKEKEGGRGERKGEKVKVKVKEKEKEKEKEKGKEGGAKGEREKEKEKEKEKEGGGKGETQNPSVQIYVKSILEDRFIPYLVHPDDGYDALMMWVEREFGYGYSVKYLCDDGVVCVRGSEDVKRMYEVGKKRGGEVKMFVHPC
jgi:hypothetical protein